MAGGEYLEWRWGSSWRWQLEWQLGLGRDTGLEDSWGGAAVGLAGSPWPRVTLEGGLGEAQQESRASWPQTQAEPGLGVGLGGAPLQPSVHPLDPG